MSPSAQLIIIELGCLDICNRNMRKFVVKYNQGIKMYYFGLLAFRLHHINVIGSDIEGGTIITIYRNTICDCILIMSTQALPDAMERVFHPSLVKCLSSLSIRSPQLHRKLWMEQKKAIRANTLIKVLGKSTLTSAQAKRVDALGIKFEDLLNLYLESTTTEAFHTVLKEREASIASHYGRSSRKGWGTPARRALS